MTKIESYRCDRCGIEELEAVNWGLVALYGDCHYLDGQLSPIEGEKPLWSDLCASCFAELNAWWFGGRPSDAT